MPSDKTCDGDNFACGKANIPAREPALRLLPGLPVAKVRDKAETENRNQPDQKALRTNARQIRVHQGLREENLRSLSQPIAP
jgi:hypothetical protein